MKNLVLVVDDDPDECCFVWEALRAVNEKIKVISRHSEEEVLNFLFREGQVPDFVLLNVVLPGSCGFKLLHTLKNNSLTRLISVYMISSSDWEIDRKKSMDLGAAGYFAKPYSIADYGKILAALLDQNKKFVPK